MFCPVNWAGLGLTVVNFHRLHLLTATLQKRTEQQALETQKLCIQYVIDIMGFGKNWHMGCYRIPSTDEC
jgi:hypothetical protein